MIEGITKKQKENGAPVYLIDGREIEVYIADFDEVLTVELQKINAMFDVILEAECDDYLNPNFAYVGKDLIDNIENIKSEIYHQSEYAIRIVRNDSFEILPNKKHLKKGSIIDVFFESNGKAPETDLPEASPIESARG